MTGSQTGMFSRGNEPSPQETVNGAILARLERIEAIITAHVQRVTVDVERLNRELCAKEGHVLGVAARPCLRCHEWFDPKYGHEPKGSS